MVAQKGFEHAYHGIQIAVVTFSCTKCLIDCFEIIFLSQKMNSIFKNKILLGITQHEATRPKRRPLSLDPSEAIDCLFKLVRTGMQWRELQPTTASYITVFKHTRRWIQSGIVHDAYASLLQQHVRNHPSKH